MNRIHDDTERADQALCWLARLSRSEVPVDDVKAFFIWREEPENNCVYARAEEQLLTATRFKVQRHGAGWVVIDVWTGLPARLAHTPQAGLTRRQALLAAVQLNWHPRRRRQV